MPLNRFGMYKPEKEQRIRATVHLKTGQVLRTYVPSDFSMDTSSLTATTVFRFPRRGLFGVRSQRYVQGDNIAMLELDKK